MDINYVIDKLKNSDEEPKKLLEEFENLYREAKERQYQICSKCETQLKVGLPKDCLLKPDYCVKKEKETIFIIWYEDLIERDVE